MVAEGDRVAVRWRADGTFAGAGLLPGHRADRRARRPRRARPLRRPRRADRARATPTPTAPSFARQIGLLPPQGSARRAAHARAFNASASACARRARRQRARAASPRASGVVRGGFPLKTMNVYLIEDDGGGVTMFDAGIKAMAGAIAAAAASLGGINRVVLGHAHADHRGAAPGLGAPVVLPPRRPRSTPRATAARTTSTSRSSAATPRAGRSRSCCRLWDGGPVRDRRHGRGGRRRVAASASCTSPATRPGLIALLRESDRLALTTDCFYTLDPRPAATAQPRVPHAGFNHDTEQARASIRKLAALSRRRPGRATPSRSPATCARQLERAAATT